MSFGKAPAVGLGPRNSLRVLSKSQQVAYEIESILEKRGVAPLAAKALTVGKELGKGRFKKVHAGRLRQRCGQDCREVVVLRYPKVDSEVKELEILALLASHAHSDAFVPEVFGVVDDKSAASIVQERAALGTLKSCLDHAERAIQFSLAHKLQTGTHIARALDFLESLHIVHADLACRNVLVFRLREDARQLVAKITDFGLAILLEDGHASAEVKQPLATRWCAPETVAYGRLSHQSDMWSFGVTMWELFSGGALPWPRFEKRAELTDKLTELAESCAGPEVLSVDFPLCVDECPVSVHFAFLSCLHADLECRPVASELESTLSKLLDEEVSASGDSFVELDDAASATSAGISTTASLSAEPCSAYCHSKSKPKTLEDSFQTEVSGGSTPERSSSSASPIRELLLPCVSTVGPLRCWATAPVLSIWTLWSFSGDDSLLRRDYMSEGDAKAAFEADATAISITKSEMASSP